MTVDALWKDVNIKKAVQNARDETYTEPHFPTGFSTLGFCGAFRNSSSNQAQIALGVIGAKTVFHKNASHKSNKKS